MHFLFFIVTLTLAALAPLRTHNHRNNICHKISDPSPPQCSSNSTCFSNQARHFKALAVRLNQAYADAAVPADCDFSNGDELSLTDANGNPDYRNTYSKGLSHNSTSGLVNQAQYAQYFSALNQKKLPGFSDRVQSCEWWAKTGESFGWPADCFDWRRQ
jgi:hypothetical protein